MSKFHIFSFESGLHSFISALPLCVTDHKADFYFNSSADMEKKRAFTEFVQTLIVCLFKPLNWSCSHGSAVKGKSYIKSSFFTSYF